MKRLLLFLTCVLTLFGIGRAEEYTLDLTVSSVGISGNGTDYTKCNGDKTVEATSKNGAKMNVTVTLSDVCENTSSGLQFKKTSGLIYNKTDLGNIKSVTISNVSGSGSFSVYQGKNQQPTSSVSGSNNSYTFANGNGFFKVGNGSSNAVYTKKITIVFEIGGSSTNPVDPGLKFSASSYTATIGGNNSFPTLTCPSELTPSYTSSNPSVATINAQGSITLVSAGETTIKATTAAIGTYKAGEASYTLYVVANGGINPDPVDPPSTGGEVTEDFTKDNGCPSDHQDVVKTFTSSQTGIEYTVKGSHRNSGYLMVRGASYSGAYISWTLDYPITNLKLTTSNTGSTNDGSTVNIYANNEKIESAFKVNSRNTTYDIEIPEKYQVSGVTFKIESNSNSYNQQFTGFTYVKKVVTTPEGPVEYNAPFANQTYTLELGKKFVIPVGDSYPEEMIFAENGEESFITITDEYPFTITTKDKVGEVTVDATWEADDNFTTGDASFTVNIIDPNALGEIIGKIGDTTIIAGETYPVNKGTTLTFSANNATSWEIASLDPDDIIIKEGTGDAIEWTVDQLMENYKIGVSAWKDKEGDPQHNNYLEFYLTVKEEPILVDVTFDFNNPTQFVTDVELSTTDGTVVNDFSNGNIQVHIDQSPEAQSGQELRFFKQQEFRTSANGGKLGHVFTISSKDGANIVKIEFTGTLAVTSNPEGLSNKVWNGRAQSVSFATTGANSLTKIDVTYESDKEILPKCEMPLFVPQSGTKIYGEETVLIECPAEYPTTIKYTINNSEEKIYSEPISFVGKSDGEYTIKAWTSAEGYEDSYIISATYTYASINPFEEFIGYIVTDERQLIDGAQYVIVGYNNTQKKYQALSSISGSYFNVIDAFVDENGSTVKLMEEMSFVTLEKDGDYWAIKIDDQYIKSAFDTGNNAGLESSKGDNTKANITLKEDGLFEILFPLIKNNSEDTGYFQYNSSQPRFTCYKGSQVNPYLYRIGKPVSLSWQFTDNTTIENNHQTTYSPVADSHVYTLVLTDSNGDPIELSEDMVDLVTTEVVGGLHNTPENDDAVEGTHYDINQDNNVVTVNYAGSYNINANFIGNTLYAPATAAITAEVAPIEVTVADLGSLQTTNPTAFAWNPKGITFDKFITYDEEDAEEVMKTISVVVTPSEDVDQTTQPDEWNKNCGLPKYLWDSLTGLLDYNGGETNPLVDGFYVAPTTSWTDDSAAEDLTVTFGVSGSYDIALSSSDGSIVFKQGDTSNAINEQTVDIYPNILNEFKAGVVDGEDLMATFNINGMPWSYGQDGNSLELIYAIFGEGENSTANGLESAQFFTPGLYFADLYWKITSSPVETAPSDSPESADNDLSALRIKRNVNAQSLDGYTKYVAEDSATRPDLSKLATSSGTPNDGVSYSMSIVAVKNGVSSPVSDNGISELSFTITPGNKDNTPTEVEAIGAEEGDVHYFTPQGIQVANPQHGQIYIVVKGNKASKVLF